MMKLFPILQILDPELKIEECKVHLASSNGTEDPLDVYHAGGFDDWQARQTKKNFERDFVISLIALPQPDRWLLAGVYDAQDCGPGDGLAPYRYTLRPRAQTDELNGRLVVDYNRDARNSYRDAENCAVSMRVAEIRAEQLNIAEFLGYTQTMLTQQHLDTIVKQQPTTWKSALASVAGVYVITDRHTGKLYVGSATGEEGIWGRWCAYAQTGHGGNKKLRQMLVDHGDDYAANFQYGILETADSRATEKEILARESHWKQLLLSDKHGYNSN